MLVLNTNLYYDQNKLTMNTEDPAGQFKWADRVLTEAANNREKAKLCPFSAIVPSFNTKGYKTEHNSILLIIYIKSINVSPDCCLLTVRMVSFQVYIIGHIPPGFFEKKRGKPWYRPTFNKLYLDLIQKHHPVISGQFFGHHHTDSFRMFYSSEGEFTVCRTISNTSNPCFPSTICQDSANVQVSHFHSGT